jgi:indolepyruvate ferredoxin oxidoreductase
VARLHLAADYGEVARDLGIEGRYAVTYHLHPPILRRLGLRKKLPLGTPFDVFGWDTDRRTERAVIGEYERLMDEAIAGALPDQTRAHQALPYETLVRLAESAQSINGYGPIKEAAVTAWRAQVSELSRRR